MTALTISADAQLQDDLHAVADLCEMTVEELVLNLLRREAAEAAIALGWDSEPSLEEDLADMEDYERTGLAIPAEEVFAYLESLATDNPLPRPEARRLR